MPNTQTLHLRGNSFVGSTQVWEQAFVNALHSCTNLEDVDFFLGDAGSIDTAALALPRIVHLLCVKTAGRHRLIHHPCKSLLKMKLWPLVLERASQAPFENAWALCRGFQHRLSYIPPSQKSKSLYGSSVSEDKFKGMMQANLSTIFCGKASSPFRIRRNHHNLRCT